MLTPGPNTVVPSFRTFRVNLGGYSAFVLFIPHEKVLLTILFYLVVSSIDAMFSHKCPCLQDDERKHAAAGEPYPWGGDTSQTYLKFLLAPCLFCVTLTCFA